MKINSFFVLFAVIILTLTSHDIVLHMDGGCFLSGDITEDEKMGKFAL